MPDTTDTIDTNPVNTWKQQLIEESDAHQETKKVLAALQGEVDRLTSSRDAFLGGFQVPNRIVSIVDVNPEGKELVVGWDTCGKCIHHIRICECPNGPTEPAYITKFRAESAIASNFGVTVTTSAIAVESVSQEVDGSEPVARVRSASSSKCKACGDPADATNADPDDTDALIHFDCQET